MNLHMTHQISVLEMESRLARNGVSVARLCREAGISQSTWSRWKKGDTSPRESTIRVLENAMEVLLAPPSRREAA